MIATMFVIRLLELVDGVLPRLEPSEKKALLDEVEDITNMLDDYLVNKFKEGIKIQ